MTMSDSTPENTSREHFVPLTKAGLVAALVSGLEPPHQQKFRDFCQMLEATLHYEFHAQLEHLCQAYQGCNPDSDKIAAAMPSQSDDDFFPRFEELLKKANFHALSRAAIDQAINAARTWDVVLHVDFDRFEHLVVYARGEATDSATRRSWRTWFRPVEYEVPIYRRLVIAFQLRHDARLEPGEVRDAIYIKLFKNIPHSELDKLLPGGEVRMTWWDRTRVFAPTVTGLAITAYKISKGALLLAFAGVYGMLAFLGLVGGTIGYGARSFFGYLRAKDKYRLKLTRNLYYQNLDNNAGVLFRLLYDAEEQEFSEAALAYFLLWRSNDEAAFSLEELDQKAEALLAEHGCGQVDFEVSDAVAKLRRWGLIEQVEEQRYRAVPINEALALLDTAWDSYFHHRVECDTA